MTLEDLKQLLLEVIQAKSPRDLELNVLEDTQAEIV